MQEVLAQPAMDEQSNEFTEIAGRLGIRGLTMTQWRFRTQVSPVRPGIQFSPRAYPRTV